MEYLLQILSFGFYEYLGARVFGTKFVENKYSIPLWRRSALEFLCLGLVILVYALIVDAVLPFMHKYFSVEGGREVADLYGHHPNTSRFLIFADVRRVMKIFLAFLCSIAAFCRAEEKPAEVKEISKLPPIGDHGECETVWRIDDFEKKTTCYISRSCKGSAPAIFCLKSN